MSLRSVITARWSGVCTSKTTTINVGFSADVHEVKARTPFLQFVVQQNQPTVDEHVCKKIEVAAEEQAQ